MSSPSSHQRAWRLPIVAVMAAVLWVNARPALSRAASAESSLRRKVAWQVALDRVGISPGIIDGKIGPKTRLATREFQRVRGLPVTGELDDATASALQVDADRVFIRYTIEARDLKEIGPVPKGWVARSKLKRLGHASLETLLAEKFHCATHLLQTLNPGRTITRLKPGDKVVVPRVEEASDSPRAARIEIDLAAKVIRVVDTRKQLAALFHCSVARSKAKLPSGSANVISVAENPTYTFKPSMWPEVKEKVSAPLTIPPGPRNPVGRCWIGLSLPGYGMHGTPNPELIGKTGSHGCIRLTNWDALRLASMVDVGTPVRFVGHDGAGVASR